VARDWCITSPSPSHTLCPRRDFNFLPDQCVRDLGTNSEKPLTVMYEIPSGKINRNLKTMVPNFPWENNLVQCLPCIRVIVIVDFSRAGILAGFHTFASWCIALVVSSSIAQIRLKYCYIVSFGSKTSKVSLTCCKVEFSILFVFYHVSCKPVRIFWNDDTICSTRVPRVLSTTGWKARKPARSRQHALHSCRAGSIVISENPQGLATHMVGTLRC